MYDENSKANKENQSEYVLNCVLSDVIFNSREAQSVGIL